MARVDMNNWSTEFEQWAAKMGAAARETMGRMVKAGGDAAADEVRKTTMWHDESGDLRGSITRSALHLDDGEVYT